MRQKLECVDAGSEFCPCYLAETNDCITCSHLQGKDFCDCNWRGVCIYHEYVMNGNKRKNQRQEFEGEILEKTVINENCNILKIRVTKTLARQLREPGAYVFLREYDSPQYFDTPMSIMETDTKNGYIYIAYQVLGCKTKKIDISRKKLLVRGPYWNALYGLRYLKSVQGRNCLVIARGIAQAPAILVLKKLFNNNNNVTFVLDKGRTKENFIKDFIADLDINIIEEEITTEKGMFLLKNILRNQDIQLLYCGGSDKIHSDIINLVDELNINPYLVVTNNNELCCGEGICGACSTYLDEGVIVKSCKTQIDVRKAIERRVIVD